MPCPADEELARLVDGALAGDERAALLAHVESCDDCLHVLGAAAADGCGPRRLAAGERLGRYQVIDLLGAGAMGAVYEARDLELERVVALKLLRPDSAAGDAPALRERLRAEARVLAQVSSPYVVAVHDVGAAGDQVFIAMERIDGPTLRQWLTEQPRTPVDIVRTFVQAGEGLAAAHEAGVVHRDFKPDNVLVGRDGRARVTDFGLARRHELDPAAGEPVPAGAPALATRTLAGTPAYMAPEQRAGAVAGPASDQYAFCLSLAEALLGERPEPGGPLPGGRIGERLRRVLDRGLSLDAAGRWPSMRALLDALAPFAGARRGRVRLLAAVAAAAALGAGGVALLSADAEPARCAVGDAESAALWDGARRQAVRRAVALPLFERVDGAVSTWRGAWARERDRTCRVAQAREQEPAAVAERLQCLDLGRRRLDAFLHLLGQGDAGARDAAVTILQELPAPEDCARPGSTTARAAGAADPVRQAAAGELERTLAGITAQRWAGQFERARTDVAAVLTLAERLELPVVRMHALVERGAIALGGLADRRRDLVTAAEIAVEVDDVMAMADAWIALTEVCGQDGDLAQAEVAAGLAAAALRRAGGDPVREAETTLALCRARERSGREPAQAAATCARAHDQLRAALPADDLRIGTAANRLGNIAYWEGRWDDALAHYQAALDLRLRVLGDDHSEVDSSRSNLAHVLIELGRAAEAEAILSALARRRPDNADLLLGLASARRERGDLEGSLAGNRQALALCTDLRYQLCLVWSHLGIAFDLMDLGHTADALAAAERAAGVGVSPSVIDAANIEWIRARALLAQGERQRARATAGRALSILDGSGRAGGVYRKARAEIADWIVRHRL